VGTYSITSAAIAKSVNHPDASYQGIASAVPYFSGWTATVFGGAGGFACGLPNAGIPSAERWPWSTAGWQAKPPAPPNPRP